ncbi:MAG: hypothetical protein ACK5K7_01420, partial [Bacilli bacterium]
AKYIDEEAVVELNASDVILSNLDVTEVGSYEVVYEHNGVYKLAKVVINNEGKPGASEYTSEITTDYESIEIVEGSAFDEMVEPNPEYHLYLGSDEVESGLPSLEYSNVDVNAVGSYEVVYGYENVDKETEASKSIEVNVVEEDDQSIAVTGYSVMILIILLMLVVMIYVGRKVSK